MTTKKTRAKSNGEGTIYVEERNGKKYYRGQVSNGYDDKGKLKRKSFSGYSKQEVLKKMNEFQYKQNKGILHADDKITFQEWYYIYLFDFRINDLKPSSFERIEGIYRNYVENTSIGKIKLVDLRSQHLQSYFNDLFDNGKPISTLKTVKKYIGICLNEAVRQEYLPMNYCKNVRLPKEVYVEGEETYQAFTLEEQITFINAIDRHMYELAFNLNLGTGLRLGELIALRWTDIDFINNTLTVNKATKRVTFIDREGNRENKIIEQSPKTETSYRTVPIPLNLILELKRHVKEQAAFKKGNKLYNDDDYIFCDDLGNVLDPKFLPRNFKAVLKKAGLREIKYHSLRHTYATRLFERGVPIKTVQALLGHKDITTTMNIYTHVMPEQKSHAAESINDLFGVKKCATSVQ